MKKKRDGEEDRSRDIRNACYVPSICLGLCHPLSNFIFVYGAEQVRKVRVILKVA